MLRSHRCSCRPRRLHTELTAFQKMVVSCDGLEGTVSGPMLQVLGTEPSQHTQVIMLQYCEFLGREGREGLRLPRYIPEVSQNGQSLGS